MSFRDVCLIVLDLFNTCIQETIKINEVNAQSVGTPWGH